MTYLELLDFLKNKMRLLEKSAILTTLNRF